MALLVFVLLSPLSAGVFVVGLALLCGVGVWASEGAGLYFGEKDDGRIVIDEVVGQGIAFAPLVLAGASWRPAWSLESLAPVVTAFVLFRVFDIWKPGPVGWAERRFTGGLGVMMDDVVAGVLAALVLAGLQLVLSSGSVT